MSSHDMMEICRGLVGREAQVKNAPDRSQVGLRGKIVDETLKTIIIKENNRLWRVPKQGATFIVQLPSHRIEVLGDTLIQRPEERLKKWWKKIRKVKKHGCKGSRM